MPRASVRATLGRPYARMKRERVGRAGGIAAACAVVCRVRVSVPWYWDLLLALQLVHRQHFPPPPAAGVQSSPAPGPSSPRSHRCRCGRAALCAHGHGGQVWSCLVVRARACHACDAFASPAADAPSRARRLSRADAQSSGEGDARPPLCADEAGESWSGQGHRGCTRRCLSRAVVRTPVLGSLTRPAAGARCWWRFQVQVRI
jgi:hypothetical protein